MTTFSSLKFLVRGGVVKLKPVKFLGECWMYVLEKCVQDTFERKHFRPSYRNLVGETRNGIFLHKIVEN